MINTMRVDKFHGYSKETVVSDMLHFFKDLDEKAAKEFVEKYWKYGCVWTKNADWFTNPNHDQSLYPEFQKAVYKYSRLAHAGEEVEDFVLAS